MEGAYHYLPGTQKVLAAQLSLLFVSKEAAEDRWNFASNTSQTCAAGA
jgi:hypothetical protein